MANQHVFNKFFKKNIWRTNKGNQISYWQDVALILEIVDARAPLATRSHLIKHCPTHIKKVVVMTKSNLTHPNIVKKWKQYFVQQKQAVLAVNHEPKKNRMLFFNWLKKNIKTNVQIDKKRRIMIVGFPNTGKSTLINHLVTRKKAKSGNEPGITKGIQWLNINHFWQIIDTPGEEIRHFKPQPNNFQQLIWICIKAINYQKIQDFLDDFIIEILLWLQQQSVLTNYFLLPKNISNLNWTIPEWSDWATQQGLINTKHNQLAIKFLNDISIGKLGPISFEQPPQ